MVFPRADSTATTRLPSSRRWTMRPAAFLMRSALATEVPPNFMTTVWASALPAFGMALKDSLGFLAHLDSRRRLFVLGLALFAIGAAIGGFLIGVDEDDPPHRVPEASTGKPVDRVSFLARLIPPAAEPERKVTGPSVPRSIADLARRLPLERKVAQVFLWGFTGTDLNAGVFGRLRRLDLGGIVIGPSNCTGLGLLGQLGGEAIVVSRQAKHVPPWVMAVQEGGEHNSFPDLPPADAPADQASGEAAGAEASLAAAAL